jgi:hypothetical protein
MAQGDLSLVGLTKDGARLVLVDDAGDEHTLPVDSGLRAALRGEHARPGQLEIQMDSALRPRDIQARIRAGETPETVATAAQTTVDRIVAFAAPVLAERAHIAQTAQRSSVRHKVGEPASRLLGDAVSERLGGRNIDPASVTWDAWRRQDGRWTLVADYQSGESSRHAEFVYDAPGRYVIAEDDEARWLVGEPQDSKKGPQPRAGTSKRRLSAVGSESELPLGADAIDMVSDRSPTTHEADDLDDDDAADDADDDRDADESTEDLSEVASAVREGRGAPEAEPIPLGGAADADWIASHGGDVAADSAADEGADAVPQQRGGGGRAKATKKTTKKSRGGRASVPSWDEIMFGGERRE